MSNIKNTPSVEVEKNIKQLRGAFEHRAIWFYLLIDAARKRGVDWEDMAMEAIANYGLMEGTHKFDTLEDKSDVGALPKYFGAGNAPFIFEQTKAVMSDELYEMHFHYCPFVSGWTRIGVPDEEIAKFCYIVHNGDKAMVEQYLDGVEYEIAGTKAEGCDYCTIRFKAAKKD